MYQLARTRQCGRRSAAHPIAVLEARKVTHDVNWIEEREQEPRGRRRASEQNRFLVIC